MTTSDDSTFRPNRRGVLVGLAAALFAPNSVRSADDSTAGSKPDDRKNAVAEEKAEDAPPLLSGNYSKERRLFRTDLVSKGPAPDIYEPLATPPTADQLFYRSGIGGELELVAWVSKHTRERTLKPAVIFLHGGNAIGQGHWQLMKPYVEAGYVVMIPSMRGENGQKGNFSGFYDEVADVLAASNRLRHLPGVDPQRIFLAGHSIGGTLAMLTAMSTKRFRAAAPISGNPDAYAFFRRYPQDIRFNTRNPREFQMRSPLCYAHSFRCPIKLFHGTEEAHFEARMALLAKRATAAGVKMDMATVPGSHNSALPGEIAESIRFFQSVAV